MGQNCHGCSGIHSGCRRCYCSSCLFQSKRLESFVFLIYIKNIFLNLRELFYSEETILRQINQVFFRSCKTLANRIFDLKYRDYNQKEFSWIYSNSTSLVVQNTNMLASTDGTTSTLTSFVLFNGCFSSILSYPFEQGSFSFSRSSPFLFRSLSLSL